MFENLAKHRKILVTGPHRSGTTFAATAIAHDTGHGLVREELCRFSRKGLEHWIENDARVVIQAPFASDICHQFPTAMVVFMHRDIEDIEASQKRMFNSDGSDVAWFGFEFREREHYHTDDFSRPISEIKYDVWQEQKKKLLNFMELQYESLSEHPLWVAKECRKDFHVRQTHAVG